MLLNRVKALLALIALLGVPLMHTGCRKPQEAVLIGVALPLSGTMAEYGQNAREGLILASEELLRRPEMKKFQLIYQDTKDAPQDTVDAVRRLIDVYGVRFIIGGLTSSGVLA
ncbi:MAG: ABC transporter substrate-binding protein, partial [Armatimonadota bacterium]